MGSNVFSVLVCRACCCGRPSKHPGIDHDAQVDAIRDAVTSTVGARCRTVDCLDVCSRSNVVVIRDRRPEASGLSALWLGDITSDDLTDALCAWLSAGAHRASVPELLRARIFDGPTFARRVGWQSTPPDDATTPHGRAATR